MGRLYNDFRANNCEVLVILGEPIEKAHRYVEILHLPFVVLADPERSVYYRYGLEKILLFLQRTASVIVDREGRIRYVKKASNPMTWLEESHKLLRVVQSINEVP